MDLIYLVKSVYNLAKYSYNLTHIFSEPINIIDNIYLPVSLCTSFVKFIIY